MAAKAVDARKRIDRNRRSRGHGPLLQEHGPLLQKRDQIPRLVAHQRGDIRGAPPCWYYTRATPPRATGPRGGYSARMLSINPLYLGVNPMHRKLNAIAGLAVALAAAGVVPTLSHAARVGEHYVVDGRCVTVTAVRQSQAYYEWSKGNVSGGGDLPASRLTQRCDAATKSVAPGENASAIRPPGAVARTPRRSGSDLLVLTAAEAKALVDAHNAVRAQVGVGPVAWDATLASFAQRYVMTLARSCALKHSAGSGFGENLAAWTQHPPTTKAVELWAKEKADYRGAGGPMRNADMEAGHYTQVVWRGTTRVGCGRTTCSIGGIAWTLVSCNYSPAGNVMGARVY